MNTVDLPDPARDTGGSGAALLHHFLGGPLARNGAALAIDVPPGRDRPDRQTLSYAALDALADRLARHVVARARPMSPADRGEPIVALLIARTSPLLYAAQIAVLRAGAAFTCLDPAFPDERMREIIADAEPVLLLGDTAGVARLSALTSGLVLDAGALAHAAPPAVSLPADPPPSHLAYVIYTSGTTGKPKGVLIEHRNIANLVASDLGEFGLGPGDRVVQGSSAAYDSSLEEVWLALASGATLVVMDDAAARLGPDVVDWLKREAVTVFCPPPTLLRSSGCADPARALPDLRLLYVGGEALQQDLADLWAEGRRMVNGYGPTECAVTCLRCDVIPGRPVGIGRPVPGMEAWVLDEALDEVADGEQGELCIGGAGVARGYRHRPDLVAEKFVDHPQFGRIYRTGDLVSRDQDGTVFYHGRIDAQVKIRGYRVELGEIEARLAHCEGVRAAACRLQAAGDLVGFVVPLDPALPPDPEALRGVLAETLPPYMVPVQIGLIDELPTSVGGKLDRARLPELAPQKAVSARAIVAPEGELEGLIAAAMADILRMDAVSVVDDFFADLGGDSLSAALLVTLLRDDTRTSWATVSDIYEARCVRELALRAHALFEVGLAEPAELALPREGTVRPVLANVVQVGWLLAEVCGAGWIGWLSAFVALPWLYARLGGAGLVLGAPLLAISGLMLYVPATIALTVLLKRVLIGRYRPIRAAVWSGWYLRHWIVVQAAQLIPWPLLQGSELQQTILRWLGARIGRRVHIHRGVDLARGGWDLLDIGDDVAIGQDAQIGLADLDRGDVVMGPIALDAGATMLTRASIGGWCRIGAGGELTQLSVLNPGQSIPAGERWDGVPARRIGLVDPAPMAMAGSHNLPAWLWDLCAMLGEGLLAALAALPAQIMAVALCWLSGLGAAEVWRWAWHPFPLGRAGLVVIAITVLSVPLTLVWSALLLRLMGKVRPGIHARWSLGYLRAWLKSGALRVAGEWLTGTIFWSRWLRLAGMRVGPRCEISTIIDVVPELVEIGAETFFADGIYLGGGIVRHGTVELAPMRLGRNTFLGNHVVIPPGQSLPDDILIGIATVADDTRIASGQARFGHPDFDLPRREVVAVDRSLTHEPGPIRYANRALWEVSRFALPVLPVLLTALWLMAVADAADRLSGPLFALVALPALTALPPIALCLAVLALKWVLIGRVKPDQHPLWSCWCSRWDYVYVAWSRWAMPFLRRLDGTFLLPAYLRAMGLKIGRRAVLGPLFARVVDPDMIEIGDGATVSAMFQAHTFEDRVLKVDRVVIRAGATVSRGVVPLYGAAIDVNTHVGAGSVVMKREHLLPGLRYQGVPTRAIGEE